MTGPDRRARWRRRQNRRDAVIAAALAALELTAWILLAPLAD
jgi:hypothetical protein